MTKNFQVRILYIGGRTPFLTLNELGERSQATIIFCESANKLLSKLHWPMVFGNVF